MLRLAHLAAAVVGVAVLTAGTASVEAGNFRKLNKHHTAYGVSQFNFMNISKGLRFEFLPDEIQAVPVNLIRYRNPVDSDMAVATLVYTSNRGYEDDSPTEVFLGCRVDTLTPHGSKGILSNLDPVLDDNNGAAPASLDPGLDGLVDADYLPENPYGMGARYVEIIAAPRNPVPIQNKDGEVTGQGRLANGLGIAVTRWNRTEVEDAFPAHPKIFSLPHDLVGVIDPTDPAGERELGTNQREDAFFCVCEEVTALGLDKDVFKAFGFQCPFDP